MSDLALTQIDVDDLASDGKRREKATRAVGEALQSIGFFGVVGHDLDDELLRESYRQMQVFFALSATEKLALYDPAKRGQRGYTAFGIEHAKDSSTPDLKEFYQIGRTDVPMNHPVHQPYGPNVWPDATLSSFREVMTTVYERMIALGDILLRACARFLDEEELLFTSMAREGDTVLRLIHYPGLETAPPPGATRAAAHEDINLITLLVGATAGGLELRQHDGTWRHVSAGHREVVVDSGDMLQNLTNGLFRSTTHRVVVPTVDAEKPRYSMPCFIHPSGQSNLTPLKSCVERTGGTPKYPSINARSYLLQRLREIGLG